MTQLPDPSPDRVHRHAGAPANDMPDDIEALAIANTVDVEEEPARKDFVRSVIAAAACLAVVAFVVVCAVLWVMWAGSFWIPGSGACDAYSGVCPERPWHDWVSSWFGM